MTQDYLAGALTFISAVAMSTSVGALIMGSLSKRLLTDDTHKGLINLVQEAMRHLAMRNFNTGDPVVGRIAATGISRAMVEQSYLRPETSEDVSPAEGPRTPEYSETGAPQYHMVGP